MIIVVVITIIPKSRKEYVNLEQTWLTAPQSEVETLAYADV
jgi:hypothetical protein